MGIQRRDAAGRRGNLADEIKSDLGTREASHENSPRQAVAVVVHLLGLWRGSIHRQTTDDQERLHRRSGRPRM